MEFQNKVSVVAALPRFGEADIKSEPMFFKGSAMRAIAGELGSMPITAAFLAEVEKRWGTLANVLFDSRSHMLMPGMFPCIPGWHTDEAPRPDHLGGQPNLECEEFQAQHMLAVVDTCTGSFTEFAPSPFTLDVRALEALAAETNRTVYKLADAEVSKMGLNAARVGNGEVVEFDCFSWHRGMAAKRRGWRFFIRATKGSPNRVALNERRTQVQVYLPDLTVGW